MADYDGLKPGQILADASVAEFIKTLGLGIAEAQAALDDNSVRQVKHFTKPIEDLGGKTLLELGLSPAFYHYQHADLSCSLQLSLKVEKDFSFGLKLEGSYEDIASEETDESRKMIETETGTRTTKEERKAKVLVESSSTGALTINDTRCELQGDTPLERIKSLRKAVAEASGSGEMGLVYKPPDPELEIKVSREGNGEVSGVVVGRNTVAFVGGGYHAAVIRIAENEHTTFTLNSTEISVQAADDFADFASEVKDAFEEVFGDVKLVEPTDLFHKITYEVNEHELPDDLAGLVKIAEMARAAGEGFVLEIEGFADRPGREAYNQRLGEERADTVKRFLAAQGVGGKQLSASSKGETAARKAGLSEGEYDKNYRKTEVRLKGGPYWLFLRSDTLELNAENTDIAKDTDEGNAIVAIYKLALLDLEDVTVTVDKKGFVLKGITEEDGPQAVRNAYARQLAGKINSDNDLEATVHDNVVTIMRRDDDFVLELFTTSKQEFKMEGSEGVEVESEFSRTRSSRATSRSEGNRAVAVGASLDVGYSRKFSVEVTGNSSISARLVSVPAPPQLLEAIAELTREQSS